MSREVGGALPGARDARGGGPADEPVAALETRLGVALADRATALAALTHKSYVNEHRGEGLADNERLEFLGDAVIDLAVSHRLMERFPAAREGDLSKMRAAVVDEPGLAAMARALDLGAVLRLGRGEELTGGRGKPSVLADAMEAVVAAVYLEGGLEAVLALVDRFLGEALERAAAGTLDRDHKTHLQELAQSRLRATPQYRVVAESGPDHAKTFEVEVDLRGEAMGRAAGRSKKEAEQAAARLGLEALSQRLAAEAADAALAASSPASPAPFPPAPPAALEGALEPVVAAGAGKVPGAGAAAPARRRARARRVAPGRKAPPRRKAAARRGGTPRPGRARKKGS
jgi:ribonuclease-3